MKHGDKVRVKRSANPPDTEKYYGGWIGTVAADGEAGAVVTVEFEEETGTQQFLFADLEKIDEQ